MRGLKLLNNAQRGRIIFVAPFTGAWIEIGNSSQNKGMGCKVAPFTGAWIEMGRRADGRSGPVQSHPSRVRGLKYDTADFFFCRQGVVAPFTGAWIEMNSHYPQYGEQLKSHPSRVRGLKFQ